MRGSVTKFLAIRLNGQTINGSANSCYVGELQNLSAVILSGVALVSAIWSASGATPLSNWLPNDPNNPGASKTTPFPPDGNSYPSITLYLTTTGTSTVTLTATVNDYNGKPVNGTTTTSFTVAAPNDCTFTAIQNKTTASCDAIPATQGQVLAGGDTVGGATLKGIVFTGSGGAGGSLILAQKIISVTYAVNGTMVPPNGTFPGLDNVFPYDTTGSSGDSPSYTVGLQPPPYLTELSASGSFVMYLLWQSNKSGSIPIPVRSIAWNWNGDILYPNWATQIPAADGNQLTSQAETNGVLTWNNTIVNCGRA